MGFTYMPTTSRKYIDEDLVTHPELVSIAEDYIGQYTGHYGPLVEIRKHYSTTAHLNTRMIRTVLNCMRHDDETPFLPDPADWEADAEPQRTVRVPTAKPKREITPEPEPGPSPEALAKIRKRRAGPGRGVLKSRRVTPAKVKAPIALGIAGAMLHAVRDANVHWFDDHDPVLRVHGLCGCQLDDPVLLRLSDPVPDRWLNPIRKAPGEVNNWRQWVQENATPTTGVVDLFPFCGHCFELTQHPERIPTPEQRRSHKKKVTTP